MKFFVGAYSTVAKGLDAVEQDRVYRTLRDHPLVRGFEIPFAKTWPLDERNRVLSQIGTNAEIILTTIPGIYQRATVDPHFGPASTSAYGRREAMAFLREAWESVREIGDLLGPDRVAAISITSAPSPRGGDSRDASTAFADSLSELLEWGWGDTAVIVEHCDALVPAHVPAKGYLSLGDEIQAVELANSRVEVGASIGINWGRSAIEGRSADTPCEHLQTAIQAGLLGELVFSGCSAEQTRYGAAWADAHAPSAAEESTSLLTSEAIAECLSLLPKEDPPLIGLKISAPESLSSKERLEMVHRELWQMATADKVRVI